MPNLLREHPEWTGLHPSQSQSGLLPSALGRIDPGPLWLTMLQAHLVAGPVLVDPFPRRDIRSLVMNVLFEVESLRCVGDRFSVVDCHVIGLEYFVVIFPQLLVLHFLGISTRGIFSLSGQTVNTGLYNFFPALNFFCSFG